MDELIKKLEALAESNNRDSVTAARNKNYRSALQYQDRVAGIRAALVIVKDFTDAHVIKRSPGEPNVCGLYRLIWHSGGSSTGFVGENQGRKWFMASSWGAPHYDWENLRGWELIHSFEDAP